MRLRNIKEAKISRGMRVILRADFDVAMNGQKIEEDFRIRRVLPTLRFIFKKGGLVRIISHLGRPDGKRNKKLSMRPIAARIERLLRKKIIFVSDPISEASFEKYNSSDSVIFFENIRFWEGEEANSRGFTGKLARWGDVYVNEAFAASHRAHSSVVSLPKILPSYAGMNLEKEIYYLNRIFEKPKHPLVAILGGAKLETKVPLVRKFIKEADGVLIGGAIANTIFYLKGEKIGRPPIIKKKDFGGSSGFLGSRKLQLPADVVTSLSREKKLDSRTVSLSMVREKEFIVDVGPGTVQKFARFLRGAKTIVWNGPMGLIEIKRFSKGTINLARLISKLRALKILGGGDTIAVLHRYGLLSGFTFVSTGGGAMLDFLAGKKLPGIEVLKKR
jgi:phosphoglycerate kinase